MSKTTAIYVRVSSRDQTHASQLPDLQRWGLAHDGSVQWFRDTFTGRTMNRPGMDKLMESLNAGKLERIVVWRLDRLGRTTKGLCELFDELRQRDVDLVSLKDGFSLASPAGRLHARILASVAEYETEVRAERVLAGQTVARNNGKKWGVSEKGWRWKVTDEHVAAIHEMRATGKPITQIARVTGLSRPTLYKSRLEPCRVVNCRYSSESAVQTPENKGSGDRQFCQVSRKNDCLHFWLTSAALTDTDQTPVQQHENLNP
jgi:DNA invertase Pin-like site-specific DNA recombinase